eukprot:501822_1
MLSESLPTSCRRVLISWHRSPALVLLELENTVKSSWKLFGLSRLEIGSSCHLQTGRYRPGLGFRHQGGNIDPNGEIVLFLNKKFPSEDVSFLDIVCFIMSSEFLNRYLVIM